MNLLFISLSNISFLIRGIITLVVEKFYSQYIFLYESFYNHQSDDSAYKLVFESLSLNIMT